MDWINQIKKLRDIQLIRIVICYQKKFRKEEIYIMNQHKKDKKLKNELNKITYFIYNNNCH